MKYVQPYGISDANASYVDGNPALGIEGSAVPAKAVEHPMREIVNVITAAGLTPTDTNLAQLLLAIQTIIDKAIKELPTNEPYQLGEFYYFRHPVLKPGFQPMQGGLLTGAAERYPAMWEYLQTADGQRLCLTEAEWQAMTTAIWHTNADGTQVGWNGIGGAPFFALHKDTGALRLPDVRGMYAEAAGFDSLGVGGVHGDGIRNYSGSFRTLATPNGANASGVFALRDSGFREVISGGGTSFLYYQVDLSLARQVPVANKFQSRAWGALACVYLGQPSS